MILIEFREYLTKFNYPNINQLNEEEVGSIFSASNRIFLLSWLVQLIEPLLDLDLNSKSTPSVLADFIYENGFCTKSQKDPFLQGDLPPLDQLIILKKMFSFKNDLDQPTATHVADIPVEKMENYVESLNLNLFPELGALKPISFEERQKKVDKLQTSCKELQQKLLNIEKEIDDKLHNDSVCYSEVAELQDKFMLSAAQFKMNATVLSQRKQNLPISELRLNCHKDVVKKTNENMDAAVKMIRNTKAITEFSEVNKSLVLNHDFDDSVEEVFTIINETAELYDDVKSFSSAGV